VADDVDLEHRGSTTFQTNTDSMRVSVDLLLLISGEDLLGSGVREVFVCVG